MLTYFSSGVNCSYEPHSFFVEALHERSDVTTMDSGDTVSFTALLAASMHEDGMTLDKGPLGFRQYRVTMKKII